MKILVADKLDEQATGSLRSAGHSVEMRPDLAKETIPDALRDLQSDVLVVRSTRVSADAITAAESLKLVVRAGAGYNTIDVAAASSAGVFVANCPGKNSVAVAELTWGLILAADRRIPQQDAELKSGQWNKKEFSKARGVLGRTLGVIGLGNIGKDVVKRAHAFGMPVIAWSRSLTDDKAEELGVQRASDPLKVAEAADVITVHLAANAETRGLISSQFISRMKAGALLVNTSRSDVVDEGALLAGLNEKGLRAALDVYDAEPTSGSSEFRSSIAGHPSVIGTHHIGASTNQAQEAIAAEVARVIIAFARVGTVSNCVNLADRAPKHRWLTVRHKNRPGVLAGVFDVLSRSEINVEWMDNVLYEGGDAACARIQLGMSVSDKEIATIRSSSAHILSVELSSQTGAS